MGGVSFVGTGGITTAGTAADCAGLGGVFGGAAAGLSGGNLAQGALGGLIAGAAFGTIAGTVAPACGGLPFGSIVGGSAGGFVAGGIQSARNGNDFAIVTYDAYTGGLVEEVTGGPILLISMRPDPFGRLWVGIRLRDRELRSRMRRRAASCPKLWWLAPRRRNAGQRAVQFHVMR